MTDSPSDYVLHITLLRGEDDLRELSPSIWRRFRCSSAINLDVFQDKILQPVLGWTRNYHAYYFGCKGNKYYLQNNMSAADAQGMHDSYRCVGGKRLDPNKYTLRDILKKQEDMCYYAYDLGDHWYHKLTLEHVVLENEDKYMKGKCLVLDGAMRCPDEDGEGGSRYQEEILDLFKKKQSNPGNTNITRQYADNCFHRVNAINVSGIFEADDFSVPQCQAALQKALRSRNPERNGVKQPSHPGQEHMNFTSIYQLQPGQRKLRHSIQDMRGGQDFFLALMEVVNTKPDAEHLALCGYCGTPHSLQKCSGCHSSWYCGKDCQKKAWKKHKKECKQDKRLYAEYQNELNRKAKIPKDYIPGERICLRKFDPNNMRFEKGTKVECKIGEDIWGAGKIIQVLHECEGVVHAYQVQMDQKTAKKMGWPPHMAQIWADWDCDYMIRKLGD